MSDAVWIAITVTIPALITSVATLVVAWRASTKADTIQKTADQIHLLTNSNLTKVTADLALALNRIGVLEAALTKRTFPTEG